MAINLDTDFIKYESDGTTAYYGYAKPGTATSSKTWSIRQIVGTGPSLDVSWNMNTQFSYTGIWSNKEDHFSYDASASVSATWSQVDSTNSFGSTNTFIDISWDEIPGIDFYRLKISDQNGITYNSLHEPAVNPYVIEKFTQTTKETNYKFIGVPNMTYSIYFTNINAVGSNDDPGNPFVITT
jgi:hypothetical protein